MPSWPDDAKWRRAADGWFHAAGGGSLSDSCRSSARIVSHFSTERRFGDALPFQNPDPQRLDLLP